MAHRPSAVKTISFQVYDIIKENICSGIYPPGYWLQEMELARELEVSRSPVREALRRLASEGLVVERSNKGIFVREFTLEDIHEIFSLRVLFENYAIPYVHKNLTEERIRLFHSLLDDMALCHSQKDMSGYIRLDTLLHNQLIIQSDNKLLQELYDRVYFLVQQFRRYSLHSELRFEESLEEHRSIVRNLIDGNLDQVTATNTKHLLLAKDKILEYMEANPHEFCVITP